MGFFTGGMWRYVEDACEQVHHGYGPHSQRWHRSCLWSIVTHRSVATIRPRPCSPAQTSGVEGESASDHRNRIPRYAGREGRAFVVSPKTTASCASGWTTDTPTNASSLSSNFNGPYNAIDRDIPVLNQLLYMIVEKPLTATGSNWGIGGRLDFMYGYDYFLTQNKRVERGERRLRWKRTGPTLGWPYPQAYAEIGNQTFPGQGRTLLRSSGEGVPSINNFFYSGKSTPISSPTVHPLGRFQRRGT